MSENTSVLIPPGELINVKGREVHVQRSGTGSPTVVFESGLLADSFAFAKVQPEIAKFASTISYDRAGMGYSEPSSNPERLSAVFVSELFDLLGTIAPHEPVVLIGWSAGGQYILEFASQHPDRVAGMLLIDSSTENELKRFPEDLAQIIQQDRTTFYERLTRLSKMTKVEILNDFGNNPPWQYRHPSTHQYYKDLVRPELIKYFLQILSFWIQEQNQSDSVFRSLGDIPLTVIYAIEDNRPLFNEEQNERVNKIWDDVQSELAGLSTQSRLIRLVSGHDIANEKPEIMIEAIKDIVTQVRSS